MTVITSKYLSVSLLLFFSLPGSSNFANSAEEPFDPSVQYPQISPSIREYISQYTGDAVSESILLAQAINHATSAVPQLNNQRENVDIITTASAANSFFSARAEATIHKACDLLSGPDTGRNPTLGVEVARLFALADQQEEEDKVDYYYKLIESFTPYLQSAVYEQLTVTAVQNTIKEYKTDFVAMAQDSPNVVIDSFKKGCENRSSRLPVRAE